MVLGLLAGCDPLDTGGPKDSGSTTLGECDAPALFARSCLGGCHEKATHQANLDLESPGLAARVYDIRSVGRADYLLIDPELPDESALIEKLRFPTPFGSAMPLARAPFTPAELNCVQRWINEVVAAGPPDASIPPRVDAGQGGADGGAMTVDAGVRDAGRFWGPSVDGTNCVPDGGAWCIVTRVPEPLYAVRGLSATNIWAVGSRGAAYHFDGSTWQRSDAGTSVTLFDVFPVASNDIWAVGERGLVLRNQGTGWREIAWAPNTDFPDAGLSTSGQPGWDLGGVWVRGSKVWVVGSGQTIATFENGKMTVMRTTHPNAPGPDLLKVWARDDDEWWAAGERYQIYDGGVANEWADGRGTVSRPFAIAGGVHPTTGAPILVSVGSGYDMAPSLHSYNYNDPGSYPWQPPDFRASTYELRRDLRAIWLDPNARGWSVGLDGQLLQLDMTIRGGFVRHVSPTKDHLLGVWGTAVNSTWAVGGRSDGIILKSR